MMTRLVGFLVSLLLLASCTVHAGEVTITGSGVWGSMAPSTTYSEAGESWAFSFTVSSPLAVVDSPVSVSNAVYSLGGVAVGDLTSVTFYDASDLGGFDLDFADNYAVSFYTSVVFDSSSVLIPGVYSAPTGFNDGEATGSGTVFVGSVPEPSTLFSLSVGLMVVGAAMVKRRRRLVD